MAVKKYLDEQGLATLVAQIKERTASVYRVKGTARYVNTIDDTFTSTGLWQLQDSTWVHITEVEVGWVFNIENAFTTDTDFVEGEGVSIEAGANIVSVNTGTDAEPVVKWDVLSVSIVSSGDSGSSDVDLTAYQTKALAEALNIEVDFTFETLPTATTDTGAENVVKGSVILTASDSKVHVVDAIGADGEQSISATEIGDLLTVEGALKILAALQPVAVTSEEILALFD